MENNNSDFLFLVENANLRGGTEILTFTLARAILKAGHSCRIVSVVPYQGEEKDVVVDSLGEAKYKRYLRLKQNPLNKLLSDSFSNRLLKRYLKDYLKYHRTRLFVNQTYDLINALPLGTARTVQVLNWSVEGYERSLREMITKKRGIGARLSRLIFDSISAKRHLLLGKMDGIVILSKSARKELKDISQRITDSKIHLIPNPLPFDRDCETVSSLQNKNLIFVGRLSYEKGVMRLLRIWKRIFERLPDYTLSIYGTGVAKKEMEEYIASNRIERVLFKGHSTSKREIYETADFLLMTSDSEGFGLVLIEAMYFGVPVISFDCPVSPKEVIGNAGLTVPCFDEAHYADTVVQTILSPTKMEQFQQRGIRRAREFYQSTILKKWEILLNQ